MSATAIYALTRRGAELGARLASELNGDLYLPERFAVDFDAIGFSEFMPLLASKFREYPSHVFIGATGIVVRALSGILGAKHTDPCMVVVDQAGRYAISLVGGHLGGGNELARKVALITGGEAVITTATDVEGLPSIDLLTLEWGLSIGNLEAVKEINAAILERSTIQVFDPGDWTGLKRQNLGLRLQWIEMEDQWDPGIPGLFVTWKKMKPLSRQLLLHPRCLIGGLGCNRGTKAEEILALIEEVFEREALALSSLSCLASIALKSEELGLLEAARALNLPLRFFSGEELNSVEVPNPSHMPKVHVGAKSVCEAAAILGAKGGSLIVPKQKSSNATLAVALAV